MKRSGKRATRWLAGIAVGWLAAWSVQVSAQDSVQVMAFPGLQPEQVQQRADENNPYALFIYGSLLYNGDARARRAPRVQKAIPYFKKAADLRVARAQLLLAQLYYLGEAIPQSDAKALLRFQQAAQQGMPDAQFGLAVMYDDGRGISANAAEAEHWYRAAALQGHAAAQTRLGRLLLAGEADAEDKVAGYMWLTLAAAQGSRVSIQARDDAREGLSAETIARAQLLAQSFRTQPHYNAALLAREADELRAMARELAASRPADDTDS